MGSEIKTRIISTQSIKPSSPASSHPKTFRLSLLDRLSPNIHGNMTFFYPYNSSTDGEGDPISEFSTKSQLLRKSLSQTLTCFYPLAGRLQDAATVNCNDDGGVFIEARTDSPLSDVLTNPDFNIIEHLLPTNDEETMKISNDSMLLVRFTLFACGGTTVSISLTHKIADIAVLIALLQSWTAACRGARETVVPDLEVGASLFPPTEISDTSASINIAAEKFTLTRFVISESKVTELKNKVVTALGKDEQFYPSRVEVIVALIWRCAMSATYTKTGSFKPSVLFQAVNLRRRMEPPVPECALGNFVWPFSVIVEEESDLELHELVKEMKKAMTKFIANKANKLKGEGGFETVMEALQERRVLLKKKDTAVFKCSSWCKFPLFETDFGWGKPIWMSSVNRFVSNTIVLMDTRDGGVEALVTLDEQVMKIFEKHEELVKYAVFNPSILV